MRTILSALCMAENTSSGSIKFSFAISNFVSVANPRVKISIFFCIPNSKLNELQRQNLSVNSNIAARYSEIVENWFWLSVSRAERYLAASNWLYFSWKTDLMISVGPSLNFIRGCKSELIIALKTTACVSSFQLHRWADSWKSWAHRKRSCSCGDCIVSRLRCIWSVVPGGVIVYVDRVAQKFGLKSLTKLKEIDLWRLEIIL